jgi:hypothetical protein
LSTSDRSAYARSSRRQLGQHLSNGLIGRHQQKP